MGSNVSRSTPVESDSGKPKQKPVGGWTEQDLTNQQVLADARSLAVIATRNIEAEPGIEFRFSAPTIDITDLQSQVVSGTNYRLEYSIHDNEGDHVLFVTALMYRPLGAPITHTQMVRKDYALENVNRPGQASMHTKSDKTQSLARQTTTSRPRMGIRR